MEGISNLLAWTHNTRGVRNAQPTFTFRFENRTMSSTTQFENLLFRFLFLNMSVSIYFCVKLKYKLASLKRSNDASLSFCYKK